MRIAFPLAAALAAALSLIAPAALAVCKGEAPDGKCEPPEDDCACDDCLAACSGECTVSNPAACTLEDACTCKDCWEDKTCTDPDLSNCKNNGDCDFFTEGCCCADCSGLAQCAGFTGTCDVPGTGGGGGAGAAGGAGGSAGAAGSEDGGSGGITIYPKNEGCGCTTAGMEAPAQAGLFAAALGLAAAVRRRRRQRPS